MAIMFVDDQRSLVRFLENRMSIVDGMVKLLFLDSLESARDEMTKNAFSRIIADYRFKGEDDDGISLLEQARTAFPEAELILLTGRELPSFDRDRLRRVGGVLIKKSSVSRRLVLRLFAEDPIHESDLIARDDSDIAEIRLRYEEQRRKYYDLMREMQHSDSLAKVQNAFKELLDSNPEEEVVQRFLEENPILFSRFSPKVIINKAPILNKYRTDFVIFSETSELFLIEIERPGKRIMKKDGGGSAKLNQALDQVRNWLHLIGDYRKACLEGIGLADSQVSALRGVVIIGRDRDYSRETLTKLKAVDLGQILLLTYDDILSSVRVLVRDLSRTCRT